MQRVIQFRSSQKTFANSFTVTPEITLIILSFKSCNELGLVALTIVFTCLHKESNEVKSGKCGGQENGPPLSIHHLRNSRFRNCLICIARWQGASF